MITREQIARRVKLRDLHNLITVARAGSMAKAATILSVSQPVISKNIANMEHALGVRLLDRGPRGVELTIYGRRLLAAGFAVFDELRQGVVEIEHRANPAAGDLSFGCNEASTLGVAPTIIARVRREHPAFFMRVVLVNTAEQQRHELSQRTIEFAIGRISSQFRDSEFATETLFEERLFAVAGAGNPWARRRRIELAELADEPWIMPPLASVAGQLVADVFHAAGLPVPGCAVTTSSFQLNHRLLEDGPFLALLPASTLPSMTMSSSLRILPVVLPERLSPVGIIRLKNRQVSPVAEIFIEAARSVARSTMARTC